FSFTAQVKDANNQTASATLSLTILNGFNITTTTLPDGYTSSAYTFTLMAAGGSAPYSNWTVTLGQLPAGLMLNAATGQLTGSPTAAGPQTFTVQVKDNNN